MIYLVKYIYIEEIFLYRVTCITWLNNQAHLLRRPIKIEYTYRGVSQ